MKITTSNERIKELLEYLDISQSEFCRHTGMNKSALSNYLKGDRAPRQDQLDKIAQTFDINPAWLMGYDVDMEPSEPASAEEPQVIKSEFVHVNLSEEEQNLLDLWKNASPDIKPGILATLRANQKKDLPTQTIMVKDPETGILSSVEVIKAPARSVMAGFVLKHGGHKYVLRTKRPRKKNNA